MGKIFVGDTPKIVLDAGSDISTQTTLLIKYKKPSGTEGQWSASVQNTTEAYYNTVDSDLDEAGEWTFKLYVELPSWKGHGEVATERIYDPDAWENYR